jgi:hypothetical protein
MQARDECQEMVRDRLIFEIAVHRSQPIADGISAIASSELLLLV